VNTNPFDDENAHFYVLVNKAGQHTIWPEFSDVPAGWWSVAGPSGRQECLDYVERNWTDMRPSSLR
jgi:MbtH protein